MDITIAKGFKTAGITAGIKKKGGKDLGLIFSEKPAHVAGVFTRNRVQAAPVLLDKERIKSGVCRAIIVNSGNANCCTGDQGIEDAKAMTKRTAEKLGLSEDQVLVASTGVIGEFLPIDTIKSSIPDLVQALKSGSFDDLARAIMTTDTFPKIVSQQGHLKGKSYWVTGVAKGAGMIRPDMATLLVFICTDIDADADVLQSCLVEANNRSFNRITVDGDTSTNDTVLLMANGMSGARIEKSEDQHGFQVVLNEALLALAKMIVKDGEGATKLVDITVKSACSREDAMRIADTIAHSNLVKTALFGEDANWGRILAAAGRANVVLDPNKIDVFFNHVQMVKNGLGCGKAAEAEATKVLKSPEFTITIDLKLGTESASMLTCDFSVDYVKINADYRS